MWLLVVQQGVPAAVEPLLDRLVDHGPAWPLLRAECDSEGRLADTSALATLLDRVGFAHTADILVLSADLDQAAPTLRAAANAAAELPNARYWLLTVAPETPSQEQIDEFMAATSGVNLKGILFPAMSTSARARLAVLDRVGMSADAIWALTAGGVTDHPNALEDRAMWSVASQSFTSLAADDWRYSPPVTRALIAVLTGNSGPLKPPDARTLDAYTEKGRQWVRDRNIGADPEWRDLVASSRGDLFRLLELRSDGSLFQPEGWAAAIDRSYLEAAGAPLAEFKREVRSNARQLLHGREDGDILGHLPVLGADLDECLRVESGLLACSRFINGAADELRIAAEAVAARSAAEPDLDPKTARADLVAAVAELPSVRPWFIRSLAIGVAAVAVATTLPPVAAAGVAALAVGGSGVLLGRQRNRAQAARAAYVASVQARLRGLAEQYALGQWKAMIDELKAALGVFVDANQAMADMEVAVAPPPTTKAGRLFLLWSGMRQLLSDAEAPVHPDPPDGGRFAAWFPADWQEVQQLDQPDLPVVAEAVDHTTNALRDKLRELSLQADPDALITQITAIPQAPQWTLEALLADIPPARDRARKQLGQENSPARPAASEAPVRITCAPGNTAAQVADGRRDLESEATDPNRVVRLWLFRAHDATQLLDGFQMGPTEPAPAEPDDVIVPSDQVGG